MIPLPLTKNAIMHANVKAILPNLVTKECNLCDKKFISTILTSRVFFNDYYRGLHTLVPGSRNLSPMDKAYSRFIN